MASLPRSLFFGFAQGYLPRAAIVLSSLILLQTGLAFADSRLVTGQGEHRMGDHDTKRDADYLALEAARRNALEQVAIYLESVTIVRNWDVSFDEIRTYTAGLLLIVDQQLITRIEDNVVVVHADLVAQVNPDQVLEAISALRANEQAREQLKMLRTEIDELQHELDEANAQLAAATDFQEVQALSQQRQNLLGELQSDDLLSQAWTGWTVGGTGTSVSPWTWDSPPQVLLIQAWRAAPWNRPVQAAQQTIMPQTLLPQYVRSTPSRTSIQSGMDSLGRSWKHMWPSSRFGNYLRRSPGYHPSHQLRPLPGGGGSSSHYRGRGRRR